jgi:periplasmic protein TonB
VIRAHARPDAKLGGPIALSLGIHLSLVAAVLLFAARGRTAMPPVYRVELIAAPAGPRAIGAVTETPAPPTPQPEPPPKRAETPPDEKSPTAPKLKDRPTRRPPAKATPTPSTRISRSDAAQKAGGGPEGGKGADVANVRAEGIDFPYPGYLQNIVRQIALRFKPRNAGALRAEVIFLIRRDGSITAFSFRTRSGSYVFDLEAQGAVEAAGTSKAFGALPDGFRDEVLTVIFSFDPQLIR